MSFPPIEQLVPHRPPMLWLDAVVAQAGDHVQCSLTVRDSHVFVSHGEVEPVVAIEWMAQAVAALVGLEERAQREPDEHARPGYVIAVPDAHFLVGKFEVGDELSVFAQRTWGDATLASFDARVERRGALTARAELRVYRRAVTSTDSATP